MLLSWVQMFERAFPIYRWYISSKDANKTLTQHAFYIFFASRHHLGNYHWTISLNVVSTCEKYSVKSKSRSFLLVKIKETRSGKGSMKMRRSYNDRYARSFLDEGRKGFFHEKFLRGTNQFSCVIGNRGIAIEKSRTRQNGPQESNRIVGEFVSTLLRVLKINRSRSIDRLYFPRDHPLFSIFFFFFLPFFFSSLLSCASQVPALHADS